MLFLKTNYFATLPTKSASMKPKDEQLLESSLDVCSAQLDHQVLALTDAGCIYSWVGAGQAGQVPKLIEALSGGQYK